MASVTHEIRCYTVEGEHQTETELIRYKYIFWDTPGFESWEKGNIHSKMKKILDKLGTIQVDLRTMY